MTWTMEAAFTGDGIKKYEPTHKGYSFWLKGISTEIKVVLSINGAHGGFAPRFAWALPLVAT